jgi:hypothetical protein
LPCRHGQTAFAWRYSSCAESVSVDALARQLLYRLVHADRGGGFHFYAEQQRRGKSLLGDAEPTAAQLGLLLDELVLSLARGQDIPVTLVTSFDDAVQKAVGRPLQLAVLSACMFSVLATLAQARSFHEKWSEPSWLMLSQ